METNTSSSLRTISPNGPRRTPFLMPRPTLVYPRSVYNWFFARFGLPRRLHSDQGRNFESKLFHELCALAGIEKSRTTPLHPRSDGQAERLNRTLLQMLRTTATDHVQNWPAYLPTVMSAYRMTVHSVTGITPNMAMLG